MRDIPFSLLGVNETGNTLKRKRYNYGRWNVTG